MSNNQTIFSFIGLIGFCLFIIIVGHGKSEQQKFQAKKDWNYYYCLYKHFYFYKHLKDHASFKQLNEKKFEPVCYDSY